MSNQFTPPSLNYPDILGLVTASARLNLDVIQCALATRPNKIAAGQNFEVLLLLQNASDVDVDVTLQLALPKQDSAKKNGMFYSKSTRLLVGLQPAEVGFVRLPASCSPKTAPSPAYTLAVELKVERLEKNRKPNRIRAKEGGGEVMMDALSEAVRRSLVGLRMVTWQTESAGKPNLIQTAFEVTPPSLALLKEFNAGWESLWTMADHIDENVIRQRIQGELDEFMPHLTAAEMSIPILEATHKWFQKCAYPLQAIEAVYVAKLLILVLCEVGVEQPSKMNPNPILPQWYSQLLRVLLHEARLANFPAHVMKENLFPDLVYDAILHGFKMISTVLGEDFGTPEEMQAFAEDLRQRFRRGEALNYGQTYLPLLMAGIIANNRITFERENIRESVHAISEAHEKRASELDDDNRFIADLVKKLIDRNLDYIVNL